MADKKLPLGYKKSPGIKRSFDFTESGVVPTGANLPQDFRDKYKDKLIIHDDKIKLSGDEIFFTIQGEGPSTGEPAVFMRLHICNLMCSFCWARGTKILTPSGQINIEELKVGDEVISYKAGSYVIGLVQKVFKRRANVIKFTTEEEIETIVTPDHIYYTSHHKSNVSRSKASKLLNRCVVKSVGAPFKYPLAFKNRDERIGYLKGAMLGDGNITKQGRHYRIYWQICDLDFAEAILDIINNDLGHKGNITTYKRDDKHKLVYRISVGTEKSAKLLLEEPENEDQTRGFIAGFFDAEGHTSRNQLILSQKETHVLQRIQGLLTDFGFKSFYTLDSGSQKADKIVINGKEQLEKFFKLFPIQISRKIDKFINTPRTNVAIRVTKVEPYNEYKKDGRIPVYNIQTTFGNIFANGYLAEQCDAYYTFNRDVEEFWKESKDYTIPKVAKMLEKAWTSENKTKKRVVFTGGEPTLQRNQLTKLMALLPDWTIEMETNGTLMPTPEMLKRVQFNCSPKLHLSGNKDSLRIKPKVLQALNEVNTVFKFVVIQPEDVLEIENEFVKPFNLDRNKIAIMPQGVSQEEINENMARCVEIAKLKGYRMFSRLHISIFGGAKRRV